MAPDAPTGDLASRILEEIDDVAIVVLDREGTIVRWFRGAEVLFGYSADEMVGGPLDRLFTADDTAHGVPFHEIEVAAASGRAADDRWEVRKDGSRVWVNGVMIALRDSGEGPERFVKIMRDRTDVRTQVVSLENRLQALSREGERKDQFLSTLAHELRNPLGPLVNAITVLRRGDRSQAANAVEIVERQAAVLRRLVDDLMDVGRIASGKIQLERRRIALNDVLRAATDDCRPLAEKRSQHLELLLLPAPITVDADADRLHQVFVNLLDNAVKYTPERGSIWVKATIEGADAVARVQDSGIGIAPEALPLIFELFTQEVSALGMANGGLGLGLSVVRDLVALHGGTVAVRSEGRGKGAEFVVRLPRA